MQGIVGTAKGSEVVWTAPNPGNQEIREVYFGFGHFCSYRSRDLKARNILVGLVGATSIRNREIARAFGVNLCLVTRYKKLVENEGVEGLLRDGRGRKPKVTSEIEAFVRRRFRKLYSKSRKRYVPKLIKAVSKEFGVELSRELIRQITKQTRKELEGVSGEGNGESFRLPAVLGERLPVVSDDNGINGKELFRRLEGGFYSRYAGGLLLNVFIAKLTERVFEDNEEGKEQYSLKSFSLMVIEMVQFGIVNIERVKRVHRKEFGVLIGSSKSPTLLTMRRKLSEAVEQVNAESAMLRLGRNYIENLAPESSTFYVDDHFDPYWGQVEVLIGFSHVYDRAMEGTEHCFIHDAAGDPVYFDLRDCYHSFNEVLPEKASRLKELVGEDRQLRLVFDRGGYDSKVFNKVGRMGIKYSVWAKGDKKDYKSLEYEEEKFLFRRNRPGKPRKETIGIAEIALGGKGKGEPKRKIILRRRTRRRLQKRQRYMYSAFVTNDKETSARDLTHDMIFRWRQECDFKSESEEFGIDQITTYLMKSYKKGAHEDITYLPKEEVEGKLVKNPALKPFRRQKQQVKKEISKIDEELGKRLFANYKPDIRTVDKVSMKRGNRKLIRRRKELERELGEVKDKMKAIPEKVRLLDLVRERNMKRFDFRKKLLMDMLKVVSRNARRMALGVLDNHYKNYRDQVDFLRRLIGTGGRVKLQADGGVTVTLSPLNTDSENEVAKAFLEEINGLAPCLLGSNPAPLKFRLGR